MAICANGAILYDLHRSGSSTPRCSDPDTLRTVAERLRAAVPGLRFAVEYGADFGHEPGYRHYWAIGDVAVRVGAAEAILDRPAPKLLALHPTMSPDDLLALATELIGTDVGVTCSSHEALLEISAAGVTKATGLAGLAGRAGIAAAEVVAFGDMPNDLPMLAWAGRAVAVANAHPEVLAVADEVTASNDDDGVALVLERLLTDVDDHLCACTSSRHAVRAGFLSEPARKHDRGA